MNPASPPLREQMDSDRERFARPHILIVTDDEDLRDFLAEGLVLGGFWTSTVASALQTIEVFRLRSFDLAIVDLALGGMSALELIKRLRRPATQENRTEGITDIPLLALADDPSDPVIERALFVGADEVLTPPLDLEELAPKLYQVVQHWRRAHPGRPYADEVAQNSRVSDD
jgi:DNA-binding response OmpR family regulator